MHKQSKAPGGLIPLLCKGTMTVFISANQAFTNAIHYMLGMVEQLDDAAPTYNPSTFNVTSDLLPLLANIAPMTQ